MARGHKMKSLTLLLAIVSSAAWADQYDRRVVIKNDTNMTIQRLFASNSDSTSWEEDMLGAYTIKPYSEVVADIDDGSGYCLYDLKALMSSGEVEIRYDVNVCEVEQWTIYNQ